MAKQHATVADFLAAQTPEVRAEVTSLRALVMYAEPRLVEIVKWNSPTFTRDGEDCLTINVGPQGAVRLILHRGTAHAEDRAATATFTGDPSGLLTWHSDIRASLSATVDPAAAREIVRAWLISE